MNTMNFQEGGELMTNGQFGYQPMLGGTPSYNAQLASQKNQMQRQMPMNGGYCGNGYGGNSYCGNGNGQHPNSHQYNNQMQYHGFHHHHQGLSWNLQPRASFSLQSRTTTTYSRTTTTSSTATHARSSRCSSPTSKQSNQDTMDWIMGSTIRCRTEEATTKQMKIIVATAKEIPMARNRDLTSSIQMLVLWMLVLEAAMDSSSLWLHLENTWAVSVQPKWHRIPPQTTIVLLTSNSVFLFSLICSQSSFVRKLVGEPDNNILFTSSEDGSHEDAPGAGALAQSFSQTAPLATSKDDAASLLNLQNYNSNQ